MGRLLLFSLFCAFLQLVSASLVTINKGIVVQRGRAAFLQPDNLAVDRRIVERATRCIFTVVSTDKASSRLGSLFPTVFDCSVPRNRVQYFHLGSPRAAKDKVFLQLKVFTDTETLIEFVDVPVRVTVGDEEIGKVKSGLTVERLGGRSRSIGRRVVEFVYDEKVHQCRVSALSVPGQALNYGQLVGPFVEEPSVDCAEFYTLSTRYEHDGRRSPNVDYAPFSVELTDTDGNVAVTERFWIRVAIQTADANQPPGVVLSSSLYLKLNQFVTTAITPSSFSVTDAETTSGDLIITIASAPSRNQGEIFHVDFPEAPVRAFCQSDIDNLKIMFRPPSADSTIVREVEVRFVAMDTEGSQSPAISFKFYVRPANTLCPVVTVNRGLCLFEGQSRIILPGVNLQIADKDNRNEIRFLARRGLHDGHLLVRGRRQIEFTVQDLDNLAVVYQHDGGDYPRDDIEFVATDGDCYIYFLFEILVKPIDNTPPYLVNNRKILLLKGGHVRITSDDLLAQDAESEDMAIAYFVDKSPRFGLLALHPGGIYPSPSAKRAIKSFTQREINNGDVYYEHSGSGSQNDLFAFRLADENVPPNLSDLATVFISVTAADIHRPVKNTAATLHMSVPERSSKPISRLVLLYDDADSNDEALVVTIIRAPYYTNDRRQRPRAGRIVRLEGNSTVTQFTQKEIKYSKILYEAPSKEIGTRPRFVRVEFSVADPAGNVAEGGNQFLNITVVPVNNQAPVVSSRTVVVSQGKKASITSRFLYARDADTALADIVVRIAVPPEHGKITFSRFVNVSDGYLQFPLTYLKKGVISYVNDGSRVSNSDSFVVIINDGVHSVQHTVAIEIEIQPTAPADVELKDAFITVAENGTANLTEAALLSRPPLDRSATMYQVVRQPRHGKITVSRLPASSFSGNQLADGDVYYKHNGNETGLSEVMDYFELSASVDGVLVQSRSAVTVRIRPVDGEAPAILVRERLRVKEGGRATFSVLHLYAVDLDSPSEMIRFIVSRSCRHGFIEDLTPAPGSEIVPMGVPVTEFPLTHISAGRIRYVQSRHDGVEETIDRCRLQATDGKNTSPVKIVRITIEPTNDEEPSLTASPLGLTVTEGETVTISSDIMSATDDDLPAETLTFQVETPPQHGDIINRRNGTVVSEFTMDSVDAGDIVYEHDGSNDESDSFVILVSDGVHTTASESIPVFVLPIDDSAPRVIVNSGLIIKAEKSKFLSNRTLLATDDDSRRSEIRYVIEEEHGEGVLGLVVGPGRQRRLRVNDSFLQSDIDNGDVLYKHLVIGSSEKNRTVKRDYFRFTVTDGVNPISDVLFFVTILPVTLTELRVVNKVAAVTEGGRITITTDLLTAFDGTDRAKDIRYSVTRPPGAGQLERANSPGRPIREFTQLNLAENRIIYVHTSNTEEPYDAFEYEVTNGVQLLRRTFVIMVDPVDDSLPVVEFYDMEVDHGATVTLSVLFLSSEDADTTPDRVIFTVIAPPKNGRLIRSSDGSSIGNTFTQREIDDGAIGYLHDGSVSRSDDFRFTVSDGVNRGFHVHPDLTTVVTAVQKFLFRIKAPLVVRPPTISVSSVVGLVKFTDGVIGTLLLSTSLTAEYGDEADDRLMYEVTTPPVYGRLVVKDSVNPVRPAVTFTQADISAGIIAYLLQSPYNRKTTSDSFAVDVTASDGTRSEPAVVHLEWAWIYIETQAYNVSETKMEHVDIVIRRRGALALSSFVGISATGVTARRGLNFITTAARLLQFDPGEGRQTWRVGIKDDGVTSRTPLVLQISLANPVNAVIFPGRTESRISIYDVAAAVSPVEPTTEAVATPTMDGTVTSSDHSVGGTSAYPTVKTEISSTEITETVLTSSAAAMASVTAKSSASPTTAALTSLLTPTMTPTTPNVGLPTGPENSSSSVVMIACPSQPGWMKYGSKCFKLIKEKLAWNSARRRCRDELSTSSLFIVQEEDEINLLSQLCGAEPCWIGLRITSNRSPRWVDGTKLTVSVWKGSGPDYDDSEKNRNCVVAIGNRWRTNSCDGAKRSFVCQFIATDSEE